MLTQGDQLQRRYQILHRLGAGGMATVYLATDARLGGRRVAVKEMDPANLPEEDRQWAIDAFRHEAQVVANLNHAGIARVSDFFEENGFFYLVMEYVEGETLADALGRARGGFAESQVLVWAGQLAAVFEYLHQQDPPVIFRDLKPSNIMALPDGSLKLIDFGIARFFKPGQTVDTVSLGTPGYAAPEQYGQGQTDARSDVYSMAVLLHQLLSGHDPALTPMNLPPLQQLNPQVSPRVATAIAQALQVNPAQRFRSVRAFAAALGAPVYNPATPPPPTPTQLAGSAGGQTGSEATAIFGQGPPPDADGRQLRGAGAWWRGLPASARLLIGVLALLLVALLGWALVDAGRTAEDAAAAGEATTAPQALASEEGSAEEGTPGGEGTRAAETQEETEVAAVGEGTMTPPSEEGVQPVEGVSEAPGSGGAAPERETATAAATHTPAPTAADTATASPSPTWTPLPTMTPSPVPSSTTIPSVTPLPVPTTCARSVNGALSGLYSPHAGRLGCPRNSGTNATWTAREDFERGMMFWREDQSSRYYVFNNNGIWRSYGSDWREGDPDYSCGEPESPPTPRRGFGSVWCSHSDVRSNLGDATNAEWGSHPVLQDYEQGFIARYEDGMNLVVFGDGSWTR